MFIERIRTMRKISVLVTLFILVFGSVNSESYFVVSNGTEYAITKEDYDKRQSHKFVSHAENVRQDKWTVENKFGDTLTFIHNKDYCVYKERFNNKWSTKLITEEEYKVLSNRKIKETNDSDGNIHVELAPSEGCQRAKLIKYVG